jgi:hypothetical protein
MVFGIKNSIIEPNEKTSKDSCLLYYYLEYLALTSEGSSPYLK